MQQSASPRMLKCFNNTCRRYYSRSPGPGLQTQNFRSLSVVVGPSSRKILDTALRVDQAGEVAANWIYRGQMDIFGRHQPFSGTVQAMWDQEKEHLRIMNGLQAKHRVRPTILWEVAKIGGYALGASTALMGKEAAMACTEAVETVIGEHYDDQLKELERLPQEHPDVIELRSIIEKLRDDELEHLDTAVEHDSQRAPAHALLSAMIGTGCRIAIELCKRV